MVARAREDDSLDPLVAVRREIARRSLIDFTLHTYPTYQAGWFHRDVARRLERFFDAVRQRKSPRLMLFAPPRAGKSELVSVRFPAWVLGRDPDMTMIATSYATSLAAGANRNIQRVIDSEEYEQIFPGTRLFGANVRTTARGTWLRNSDVFEVVNHKGIYRSVGIGGGITGKGGHILIIDDVVSGVVQAASKTWRERVWEWYCKELYTRQAPGAGILIVMTRWNEDDLAGRLLDQMKKKEGDRWEVIRYPAIAEEDEYAEDGRLLRRKGEALHPERYGAAYYAAVRAQNERTFAALFQQRPAAAEGIIFLREHWRWFRWPTPDGQPPTTQEDIAAALKLLGVRRVVQSWDTAFKKTDDSDFSACVTLGERETDFLVLDCVKRRFSFPELKREAVSRAALWRPHVVLVEDKASGQSLVQELREGTRLPVIPVKVDTDKLARAHAVTPLQEANKVLLPEGAPWVPDFVDSLASFPNGAHDDDVDAFDQGLSYLSHGGGGMGIFEFMRTTHAQVEAARAAAKAGTAAPAGPSALMAGLGGRVVMPG